MTDATTAGGGESLTYSGPIYQPRRSGLRYLAWAVGIVVIVGMMGSVMLPSLCRAREPANRVKCGSNLRQIGQAISLYANENGGHYPPSLSVLLTCEDLSPEVVTCPSTNDAKADAPTTRGMIAAIEAVEANRPGHQNCLSYIYVGRNLTTKTVTDKTIVAYEPLDNHDKDGTNVLYGDGSVEWVGKQEWPRLAESAGIAVVRSLTTRP